ncbi:MAG TPA: SRPBCC domain-containing protein [Oligoflexus sp.]|uniref:SRPBCC family protein n=1 Tax=Oligoflexus sp. TaxID=1971216 RepID=UPI002D7F0BC6|nr:SRPBCC domain-containing protein [Oligoflexus sp.]HET9241567.1 SRPBCC domain-containing protein [Oligoflexus sp.]
MDRDANDPPVTAEPEVLITRVLNFPRELVFDAWTRPDYLMKWYAPHGCSIRFVKIDVREGGSFHSCIDDPKFGECWVTGSYLEVKRPERLVFTMTLSNEAGDSVSAKEAGHDPEWQQKTTVTLTLTQIESRKTKLVLHQNVSERLAKKTGAYPSWLQMLDRLETLLTEKV